MQGQIILLVNSPEVSRKPFRRMDGKRCSRYGLAGAEQQTLDGSACLQDFVDGCGKLVSSSVESRLNQLIDV